MPKKVTKKTQAKGLTSTKKTAAKPAAKKTTAKKTTTDKAKATTATLRIPAVKQPTTKRPSQPPAIPNSVLDSVSITINSVEIALDEYAAHLRALDSKRLNGVGMKKLGFIQETYDMALANPESLP